MSETPSATLDVRSFLLALLTDLASDEEFPSCFKGAQRELHLFFWRLKQDEQAKVFVQELMFDSNGNCPHCDQLDELLQEFQLSGVLSRSNPTYRYNDIAIAQSDSADGFKKRLSPALRETYKGVSDDFKQELGVRNER